MHALYDGVHDSIDVAMCYSCIGPHHAPSGIWNRMTGHMPCFGVKISIENCELNVCVAGTEQC